MVRFSDKGSGWHSQSGRHRNARLTGHAGGTYAGSKSPRKFPKSLVSARKGLPKGAKNMTFNQLKRKGVFLPYQGDADKDGVVNVRDCRPLNKNRQDEPRNYAWAYFTTKDNKQTTYYLQERDDGFYIKGKKIAPKRNYMQAELRFKEWFAKKREELQSQGRYKNSYSSTWNEPPSHSFTFDYEKKPQRVTKLHQYGMEAPMLEFTEHKNITYNKEKGRWEFETVYHALNWRPSDKGGKEYFISENKYVNEKNVSSIDFPPVHESDKKGVEDRIFQIKKLREFYK